MKMGCDYYEAVYIDINFKDGSHYKTNISTQGHFLSISFQLNGTEDEVKNFDPVKAEIAEMRLKYPNKIVYKNNRWINCDHNIRYYALSTIEEKKKTLEEVLTIQESHYFR